MIHIIFTGGTISMHRDMKLGGNVPVFSGADLCRMCPGLEDVDSFTIEDWARVPACHLGPVEIWALRNRVKDILDGAPTGSGERPRGIVITMGTDLIEDVAYVLARTIWTRLPIVITGAMKTRSDAGWDGPRNLLDAARVAAAPSSEEKGVVVVFAGRILAGAHAQKFDSVSPNAFVSAHYPEMGKVTLEEVTWYRPAPTLPSRVEPPGLTARVAVIPMIAGDDGTLLDLAFPHYDGVVLQGFGAGNVPPGALPAIRRWLGAEKPVVLSTRCPQGEVQAAYAFEGGGAHLVKLGVRHAGLRTTAQARMELVLTLSANMPYGP
ncbi:MAG: asparaginase [Gemmatimonadota bacterium]